MLGIENREEIFDLFDVIKSHLNEIIVNGIASFNQDNNTQLVQLREKLDKLKLLTISNLLKSFMKQLNLKNSNQDNRENISSMALKIITYTRLFESVMTLEIIKSQLIEDINKDGS